MSQALEFGIKKQGFPIKIGNIEFFFDVSHESMRDFIERDKKAGERLNEIKKQADAIQQSDDDELTKSDKAFELKKEELTLQYDAMFGDGAFNKIYSQYPDIRQLEKILIPIDKAVGDAINKWLDEDEKERKEILKSKKSEALKKQKAKQK